MARAVDGPALDKCLAAVETITRAGVSPATHDFSFAQDYRRFVRGTGPLFDELVCVARVDGGILVTLKKNEREQPRRSAGFIDTGAALHGLKCGGQVVSTAGSQPGVDANGG